MITKSRRREYFALHLTKEDREALKTEAKRRSMSMSALGALFIKAGLAAAGCTQIESPVSNEVDGELPLEI